MVLSYEINWLSQYITEKVSVLLGICRALHVYPNGLHEFFVEFHIRDENQITEIDAAMMLTDPFKACNRWIRQIGWNT